MKMSFVRLAAAACLAVPALPAVAQTAAPPEYSNLIGPALRSRPAYDGSRSQDVDVVPLLDYDNGPLFARTVQGVLEGGVHAQVGSGFTIGAQLAYEEGRKASEAGFLRERNVADLGVGASYGVHAEWDTKLGAAPVLLLARVRQQVRSERGAEADLRATVGVYKNGPFQAGIFGQMTWADGKSMRTYYGQPGFDPSGGLLFASAGPLGSYDIDPHWTVMASIEGRRLQGDAARSPLAEKKSSYYAVAGVAYRF
ncbi:MAG TPA: MipA/OmpV family protein [Burkholderiales bacterium]|nr:MipA/OmpV family protein [Burkholderiales bacterium]